VSASAELRPVREKLTASAFELFDEQGYEQTTVDDIAERAGVGRTTLFRHFPSKEALIFPDHESVLADVRARLAAADAGTALVAVHEAARLVLRHYLSEGDRARSRFRLTSSVEALRDRERASAQHYQRLFREFLLSWLVPGQGTDPGTGLRADLAAAAVVTAHNHVLRRWLHGRSSDPEEEFAATMAEVLSRYPFTTTDQAQPAGPGEQTSIVVLRTTADLAALLPSLQDLLRNRPPTVQSP
jgi:AcrR family transcriptional regulator